MKKLKRLLSLALVMALALSMNITSFAAGSSNYVRPVDSVATTISGVSSVTIGGTVARIEQDVNENGVTEDQIYVRANLTNSTEYALQHQNIVINTSKSVNCSTLSLAPVYDDDEETVLYWYKNDVNLLNTYYDITIGSGSNAVTVRLAAGLTDGAVLVDVNDPLRADNLAFGSVGTTLTATNVENEFSGNPYYGTQNWTNVVYQFTGAAAVSASDTSAVPGTMTVASGATVSGCASASGSGYTFNLSGANPYFTVTNNGQSRNYYVSVEFAATGIRVTYGINLSEVVGSSYYTGNIVTQCTEILNGAEGYFNSIGATNVTKTSNSVSAVITVPSGTDAMQPMLDLTAWANANNKFSYATSNSGTYLATLDGLGEFSCGNLSGWMYMDGPYTSTCKGPNVGAASYTMVDGGTITWYMTTNYFNHF